MRATLFLLGMGGLLADASPVKSAAANAHKFARADLAIPDAPAAFRVQLGHPPNPDVLSSPVRMRVVLSRENGARGKGGKGGIETEALPPNTISTNTVLSGVYPVVNVSWGNREGVRPAMQRFVSYVDTGSSDTFAVLSSFQCLGEARRSGRPGYLAAAGAPASSGPSLLTRLPQRACRFGTLYDEKAGAFINLTERAFRISYFPETASLSGSMVLTPMAVGDLSVPLQEAALVDTAMWTGDGVVSGLLGLGYPGLTRAHNRQTGRPAAPYFPFFTRAHQIYGDRLAPVFSLAMDRVASPGTPSWQPAGQLALGGLVDSTYYEDNFTSVAIEKLQPGTTPDSNSLGFYVTTVELEWAPSRANTTGEPPVVLQRSDPFQVVMDSGTAANFVPTTAALTINSLFDPPALYNETLRYYVVDCAARPPYVAFRIGGVAMAMDPRDLVVRAIDGVSGDEDVCFSAIANGGAPPLDVQVLGSTWQRGYVVAYDQGKTMLHIARRRAY